MQATLNARAKALADRLCRDHGGAAELVRTTVGDGSGNPWDPLPTIDELHPVSYIETGYQVGLHDAELVQSGDLIGVLAVPADIVPKPIDRLRVPGRSGAFTLLDLKPLTTNGGAVICYSFQARV